MTLSLVVAMDKNRAIGVENQLPWRLSVDLRRFKSLTMGHSVIMGRKTFESIGKVLPGRINIVLSRKPGYQAKGVLVVPSLAEALTRAARDLEVFIIGGGEVFREALPFADKIYATLIDMIVPRADTYFPMIDPTEWKLIAEEEAKDPEVKTSNIRFLTYVRLQSPVPE